MYYLYNVFATFLGITSDSCVAVNGGTEICKTHQKDLYLCSEDERKSYRFGMTRGRVINDRIYIFG